MYIEGGVLGQDSTVHVGLPSEPIWLKNKMRMIGDDHILCNILRCMYIVYAILHYAQGRKVEHSDVPPIHFGSSTG